MTIEAILKTVPFFSPLADEQVRNLACIGKTRSVEGGQVVFSEGDPADGLYVVLSGRVRICGRDDEGHEIELSTLGRGDFFGELAILDGKPRSATVSAVEPCRFFTLGRHEFFGFLSQSAHLMSELLAGLSHRIRVTNEKFFAEMLRRQKLRAEMEIERHRSLSQMVAGVAHEINTPLGIINAAASVLGDRLDPGTVRRLARGDPGDEALFEDLLEAARLIQAHIGRANRLVQSFKTLSVRQITDTKEKVNLGRLVNEVVDLFRIQARLAHLDLQVKQQLGEGEQEWEGYPGYLSQVLLNLLTNVERYAYPAGEGGRVEVVLSALPSEKGSFFRLTVRDFGRGIPPDHLTRVFEPFFTTGRDLGGTGLGLAIVHNIVTSALQGTIAVESVPGQGAAFHLTFP